MTEPAFDLLYGQSVQGPLGVLQELWENCRIENPERGASQYITELQDKLD